MSEKDEGLMEGFNNECSWLWGEVREEGAWRFGVKSSVDQTHPSVQLCHHLTRGWGTCAAEGPVPHSGPAPCHFGLGDW